MTIQIYVKKIGKKLQALRPWACHLDTAPTTLRELITCLVEKNVAGYNRRLGAADPASLPSVQEMEDMAQAGKIGFGISYGTKPADPGEAAATAISAFSDGLYRFFLNDGEVTDLDAPLELKDNDAITIIPRPPRSCPGSSVSARTGS